MPDYRVTFRGDLGNLAQFDAAVKNSAISSARAMEDANRRIAASAAKISGGLTGTSGAGAFLTKQKGIADAVNNTFRQSGEIVRRFVSTYTTELDKISGKYKIKPIFDTAYSTSFDKARGNLEAYIQALDRIKKDEAELNRVRRNYATGVANRQTQAAESAAIRQSIKTQLATRPDILSTRFALSEAQANQATAQAALAEFAPRQRGIGVVKKNLQTATADVQAATQKLTSLEAPLEAEIARLDALDAKLLAADAKATSTLARRERNIFRRTSYQNLKAAANATPPIQADLAKVLNESPDLQKQLLKGGLGLGAQYGTQDFQRALAQQEAAVTSYTRNLRTGVRTVQGEFKDINGLLNKFTVDVDDQGKVIGRWGGQLGGAGSILRQTVRDFQKVIEWTVATTVVFGSLATVVGQLQSINELNTLLTRFSVTAQTTSEETSKFFDSLTQVSISTATPLKEIITVADDIALATRQAGISTEEWKGRIIDLTTAVGIFTNLTGTDTVQAADQLSAAFKQLDVAPSELIGILNKVTAVAGGQATAIADIIKSVASLAEAAKGAGLSIDQQIASVQVLSQVTNKTSAEVATAFKNLFGSISSVGSEKILKEFGIEIRDASGGVRDFLDIYRDVADALAKGIIPQNRLPDVLRGIAGGPRRAPDAAALLANIGRIDEVVGRSQNATNEALVANAKILDTNQAKITQFQNAIDAAVFKEFGQAVKELTATLASFGTTIAGLLTGLNSGFASTIIKTGLLVAGLYAFGKVLALIGRGIGITSAISSLKNLSTGFQQVAVSAEQAAADARLASSGLIVPPGTKAPSVFTGTGAASKGGFKSFLKNNKAGLLIGAAGLAGAAAGQVTGESGDLANLLQIGGTIAALIPGLQAFGIAAAVAGTAMQLFGKRNEEAKQRMANLGVEVHTLTETLKTQQEEANQLSDQQQKAGTIVDSLASKTKKTAEEQAQLSTATSDYVTATLGLATANAQVAQTFQSIIDKIPELSEKYLRFKDIVSRGGLSPEDPFLKDLQARLAKDILEAAGQGFYGGATIPVTGQYRPPNTAGGTIANISTFTGRAGPVKSQFNLADLIERPEDLTKLFGRGITSQIPRNEESLALIQGALNQLIQQFQEGKGVLSQDDLDRLVKAVTALSAEGSSFTQNAAALAQLSSQIQAKIATGQFTGEQARNATLATGLATTLNTAAGQYTPLQLPSGGVDPALAKNAELVKTLSDAASQGTALTNQQFEEIAKNAIILGGAYDDLLSKGKDALELGIIKWLKDAGVSQEVLDSLTKKYNLTLSQTQQISEDLVLSLDKAKDAAREKFADRALQLLISKNSGDFDNNAKGLQTLREQNLAARDTTIQLIDAIGKLSQTSFVDLNNQLSQIIGLQGIYISDTELSTLSTEDLADRVASLGGQLIENAVSAGVNAAGIAKLKDEILKLIGAIDAIPAYKQIIIDYHTVNTGSGGIENPYKIAQSIKNQQAYEKSQNPTTTIQDIIKQINKIIKSGQGSNIGQLPKSLGGTSGTSSYNAPGLLDIPQEIATASNAQALLKQAVANAKKLQSQVPGATKANKNEIVELLNGTKRVLETRGIGEDFLRRALDELRDEIKRQNDMLSKADTIRRIRVGAGDFSAIANVPINSKSGVSVGGPQGPISISLDINGTVLTPAQFAQFADLIAASLKRQLSLG